MESAGPQVAALAARIVSLELQNANKDDVIASMEAIIASKDAIIASKDAMIAALSTEHLQVRSVALFSCVHC